MGCFLKIALQSEGITWWLITLPEILYASIEIKAEIKDISQVMPLLIEDSKTKTRLYIAANILISNGGLIALLINSL